MAKRSSVLTKRDPKTKAITFKVTDELYEQLEKLDQRLAAEAPGTEFNRAEVCTEALADGVRQANAELDALKQKSAA